MCVPRVNLLVYECTLRCLVFLKMNVIRRSDLAMGPCNVIVWAITGRNDCGRRVIAELAQTNDWECVAEMRVCLWHDDVVAAAGWKFACSEWRYEIISHHW